MYEILKRNGINVLSVYCILLIMALKRMAYNCKGCNLIQVPCLIIYCINALYCCCMKPGCTPVKLMYLSNIFQNGHPLMYVELLNLYYSMGDHIWDTLYIIVRFLSSHIKCWHSICIDNDKHETGWVPDILRYIRSIYHYSDAQFAV